MSEKCVDCIKCNCEIQKREEGIERHVFVPLSSNQDVPLSVCALNMVAHSTQLTMHSWQCTVHSIQLTQSYCRFILQSQLAQPNCTSTENTASSPSSKQTSIKVSGCRTVLRPEHCLLGKGVLVALVAGRESFLSDNLEIFDTNFEPKFAQIYSEISPVSLEFYNAAKNNTREFSVTSISLQQIYWDLGEETQRAHWPPFGPTSVF